MVSQMKGWGLSTHMQFIWIKRFIYIKYAVAHAQSLWSKAEADDRTFKYQSLQDTFDKTNMHVTIRYQHIYAYVLNYLSHIIAMIDKGLPG